MGTPERNRGRGERSGRGRPGKSASTARSGRRDGAPARRPTRVAGPRSGGDRSRDDGRPRVVIPDDITGEELDRGVRAELRSLPDPIAERVARLLVAVAETMDDDPAAAVEYALAAKASAARLAVVREALGLAAYAKGDYALALTELRAVRRMTGAHDHLAILADCERGLGRPQRALDTLAEIPEEQLSEEARIEARLVAAGARTDLGQADAALLMLQIPALTAPGTDPWLLRLRYAYADALLAAGRESEAWEWFRRVADGDTDAVTDAAERLGEGSGA